MKIRKGTTDDFNRIMEIYAYARKVMADNGNYIQWGPTYWPPEELVREDIEVGRNYVCTDDDGKVIGTFCYIYGKNIDRTYDVIEDGEWSSDAAYGVVHRIASDGTKGVGTFCINWALKKSGYLRIDTHANNKAMTSLLPKLGFKKCGVIHVVEDNYPRFAYDRICE